MYKVKTQVYLGVGYQSISLDNGDGSTTSIPVDPANTDYQQYLKWLEEGNTPLPADTPEAQA